MRFLNVFSGVIAVFLVSFSCSNTGMSPVEGSGTIKAEVRIPAVQNLAKRRSLAKSALVPLPQVTAYAWAVVPDGTPFAGNYDTIPVSFTGDTTFEFEVGSLPIGVYDFSFYTIGDHPYEAGQARFHSAGQSDFHITDGDTTSLNLQGRSVWHYVVCKLPPPVPSEVAVAAIDIDNIHQYPDAYDSVSFTPGDYSSDTLKVGGPLALSDDYSRDYRITLNLYDSSNDLCYTGFINVSLQNDRDWSFSLTLEKITSGAQGMLKATVDCLPGYRTDIDVIYP